MNDIKNMKTELIKDNNSLIITYKTIKEIMDQTSQTKNTAFVFVKNYLANLICDNLENSK